MEQIALDTVDLQLLNQLQQDASLNNQALETTANQMRIHEEGRLIAVHTLLQGRRQRSVLTGHRHSPRGADTYSDRGGSPLRPGHAVATRSLGVYWQIARQLVVLS